MKPLVGSNAILVIHNNITVTDLLRPKSLMKGWLPNEKNHLQKRSLPTNERIHQVIASTTQARSFTRFPKQESAKDQSISSSLITMIEQVQVNNSLVEQW
jgi:hypothetical protein